MRIGEPNRALVTCERGLRIARRINDRFEEAATCRVMAMAHLLLGHRERALRSAREGAQLARKLEAHVRADARPGVDRRDAPPGRDSEEKGVARDHLWEARSLAMTMNLERWVERTRRSWAWSSSRCLRRPRPGGQIPPPRCPRAPIPSASGFGIVTQDPRIAELIRICERAATSRLPILILGEKGSGREMLARAAHELGDRRDESFLWAAAPRFRTAIWTPISSAMTGVSGPSVASTKPGLFEGANGGTIYLDEVSELLVGAQAKLLRVIEMGELRRVGAAGVRHVDVRVIAASTRDLAGLVRRGLFRDDLYYRLNGIRLEVPPLRDRVAGHRADRQHFLDTRLRPGAEAGLLHRRRVGAVPEPSVAGERAGAEEHDRARCRARVRRRS